MTSPTAIIQVSPATAGALTWLDATHSSPGASPLKTYKWTFPDGGVYTTPLPRVPWVFPTAGSVLVKLTVIDTKGRYDTETATVEVVPPMPGVLLTVPALLDDAGNVVTDALLYSYIAGTETLTPLYRDPSLTTPYPNPLPCNCNGSFPTIWGDSAITYALRLVSASAGAVNRAPIALLQYVSGQLVGEAFVFSTAGTGDPDGDPVVTVVDWGDGTADDYGTDLPATISHVYNSGGLKVITLRVSDAQLTTTVQVSVSVAVPVPANIPPGASLVYVSGQAAGSPYTVTANASDPDGVVASGSIDWGDSQTTTWTGDGNYSHTYAQAGTYAIVFTVLDNQGAPATATRSVTVEAGPPPNQAPTATLAYSAGEFLGDPYTLLVTAADADGTIVSGSLDWGDGTTPVAYTGNGAYSHTYALSGSYTATLAVTDNAGATTTTTRTVTIAPPPAVNQPPIVGVTFLSGSVVTLPTQVTVTASDPDGSVVSGLLEWGDGQTTAYAGPGVYSHPYAAAGSYLIVVTVTDNAGASASAQVPVTITTTTTPRTIAVPAGGDLQAALNAAQGGDTIVLAAGATFTGNFTVPNKSGSSYLVVKSSGAYPGANIRVTPANAATLAKIQSPNYLPALQVLTAAHHVRFEGLEFGPNLGIQQDTIINIGYGDGLGTQTSLAQVPHDLVFDRCWIHGDPTTGAKRGIALHGKDVTITNCCFTDFKLVNTDTQAIAGWNGPGPFTLTNNLLQAGGECLLFGGSQTEIPNLVPSDIVVRDNTFSKPTAWRTQAWTIKNLFELKNAQRVTVQNNIFEDCWVSGQAFAFALTPRASDGEPWVIVADVSIEYNTIRRIGNVFNLLGTNDIDPLRWDGGPSQQTARITIRRNLISELSNSLYGDGSGLDGRFLQIGGTVGVDTLVIDHNTVVTPDEGSKILYVDTDDPTTGLELTNNIFPLTTYGLFSPTTMAGDWNQTLSAYFTSPSVLKNVFIGVSSTNKPTSNFYPATVGDVGFANYAGGNYLLLASSPYAAAATDGGPCGYSATLGAVGGNGYYTTLTARGDFWTGNSLRTQALINAISTVSPNGWVTYDPTFDAAKAVIPPFFSFLTIAAVSSDRITFSRALTTTEKNLMAKTRAFKVDSEILTVFNWTTFGQQFADGDTSVLVNRAQFGTALASHSPGTLAYLSQNSLLSQLRVPLGTADGQTYLITWDARWDSAYLGTDLNAGGVGHKEFQLGAGNNGIWLEVRTRADGIDGIGTVVGFDRTQYVGLIDGRYYQDSSATQSGLTSTGTIKPQVTRFYVRANRWTRFWWFIDQRANDFDYCTLWVADEATPAVKVFDALALNAREVTVGGTRTISHWWLELNSSFDLYRGATRDLVSWARNVVALRGIAVGSVPALLTQPV